MTASSVADVGDTSIATAAGGLTSTGHALLPAAAGADVTVLVGAISMSAVSSSPTSSVTVSRTMNEPVAGAFTDVVGVLLGPVRAPVPLTTSQK